MVLWSARRPNAVEHWPDDRADLIDQNRIGLHVKQLQIRLDLRLSGSAHQSTGDIRMVETKTNGYIGNIYSALAA